MRHDDGDFRIRPGRSRDRGSGSAGRGKRLAAQVRKAAARSGYTRSRSGRARGGGTGTRGRGRRAMAAMRSQPGSRRVTVMARVVRHRGARFRAAPLARHISYLEREGVTRDGREASMFDADGDAADRDAFAARCEDDRHHFRMIVSPEDAVDLGDLRAFTRDLMADMQKDMDSRLDWVAVDHWNTDNPHVHILVRGVADDGTDLVIDRGYIAAGIRGRAEALATLELGPRSEFDIQNALAREVDAERWTSLDSRLRRIADETGGVIDLRPSAGDDRRMQGLLIGRAAKLEQMGLAERSGAGLWTMDAGAEPALRAVALRGDIIKTMHQALTRAGGRFDPAALAFHEGAPDHAIIGRLVERGLQDELAGSAYAIVDGADGRTHHIRFDDMERTGDARPGAIVELRKWQDGKARDHMSLATRSDLPLAAQVAAPGATWLDRQLVAREPVASGSGFGLEIRQAMDERTQFLVREGLASRVGDRLTLSQGLIDKLAARELDAATAAIAARTGLAAKPSAAGEHVSGIYRERVTLASGRFAMIDDGLGFQLVPWRPALDRHLGQHITGTMSPGGTVDWAPGRGIGI